MGQFAEPRLVDFSAVGPVVTMDLVTDWSALIAGQRVNVVDWPLRMQVVRDDGRYQALRLSPRSRRDAGELRPDRTYVHDGLKLRIPPGDSQVDQTQHDLTEVQVTFSPERGRGEDGVKLQVLGHRARPGESAEQARVWLTGGAIALRPGMPLDGPDRGSIGSGEARIEGSVMHQMFPAPGGWVRERWLFIEAGTRHFLIRSVAEGNSQRDADLRFEASRDWFADISDSIVVE